MCCHEARSASMEGIDDSASHAVGVPFACMAATFATAEIAEAVRSARTERLGGTVGSAKALLTVSRARK